MIPYQASSSKNSENDFALEIINLWEETHKGHMVKWEYAEPAYKNDPAGGDIFWTKASQYPAYYLYKDELKLIEHIAKNIADITYPTRFISEFGPGRSEKILPILNAIYPSNITGVDFCQDYLKCFENEIKSQNICLVDTIETDFVKAPPYFQENMLLLCLGSTFFNTPMKHTGEANFDEMISILIRWRRCLTKGGYILIGQDINNDPETLHAAYNQTYIKAMTESLWHRAARELSLFNFNPYAMEYRGIWDEKNKVFKHTVASRCNQTIYLDGIRFNLKAGHQYCQSNSFKLSSEDMRDMIKAAGMTSVKTWTSPQKRMVLHLMSV